MTTNKDKQSNEIISIEFEGREIFAMQIAIADQLALYEDISNLRLDNETVEQAKHLRNVYRSALHKLDINNEGLLDSWDKAIDDATQPLTNVVDINSARKETDNEIESE